MPFKETKASISTTERDAAAQASQDCRDCGGAGVVAIFHPAYSGQSVGVTKDGRRYATTAAAHCHCLFGRWIRDHLPPEIQARIPRVEDILSKRSKWLLEPPGYMPKDGDLDGPRCPRCNQPMGGGHGGLPWMCFRACTELGSRRNETAPGPLPASNTQGRPSELL